MDERRQTPRLSLPQGELAVLRVAVSAQVLDISLSGVLLLLSEPVDVGARGLLRLAIGGSPFAADVIVRRVSTGHGVYRVGASFTSLGPEHRRLIEQFTTH